MNHSAAESGRVQSRGSALLCISLVAVLLAGWTQLASAGLTNALALYYSFDSNFTTNAGLILDDSGNSDTGTVKGAIWAASGISSGACHFAGTGDCVDVASPVVFTTNDFTICGWIQTTSDTSVASGLIGEIWDSGYHYGYHAVEVYAYNNRVYADITDSGYGGIGVAGDDVINDGSWHFFAIVRSDAGFVFYSNGTRGTSNIHRLNNIDSSGTSPRMGNGLVDNTNRHLNGSVDEFRIYRRALSPSELVQLYTGPLSSGIEPLGDGSPADPYQITELRNLVWMGDHVGSSTGKYYTVLNDIDAATTTNWNSGAGFVPIGNSATNFMGIFNGNGKVIRNLSINRSGEDEVGLFGYVGSGGVVKDFGLAGGSVVGAFDVGGLVGCNYGTVSNCYVTVSVTGGDSTGGLIGWSHGTVSGCHATGSVSGQDSIGGFIGEDYGTDNGCYATGPVTGSTFVGGLVGLAGGGGSASSVSNCYALGSVAGGSYVGGLVGANRAGGSVDNCYATGPVSGTSFVGGLAGFNYGTVNRSYWDTNTTGQATSAGGTGKTTAQMKQQATFTGWDFAGVWDISENTTCPYFTWQALGPFAGAADLGSGWKWLSWLGYFSTSYDPWIFHLQHSWMFSVGTSPRSLWLYDLSLGWLWTSSTVYPYLYRSSDGAWLYYLKDSSPRWFYNFKTNGWWEDTK